MTAGGPALVLSCEHAGNRVPTGFPVDTALGEALGTHRGWDPGALGLARRLARRLGAPLRHARVSRLVIEMNRSEGHPDLFSTWSARLPASERRRLVRGYHRRYRARVREALEAAAAGGGAPPRSVVHISVHTFTPILDGEVRTVDVGILFDPGRPLEQSVATAWASALREVAPGLRVRFNEPYDGRSDGLVTALRLRYAGGIAPRTAGPGPGGGDPSHRTVPYAGLELEVNQGALEAGGAFPTALVDVLAESLRRALAEVGGRREDGSR